MNNKISFFQLSLFATIFAGITILFSCQPKERNQREQTQGRLIFTDSDYVTAVTSGDVSSSSLVVVQLKAAPSKIDDFSKELSTSVFNFKPGISGKAYFQDETTLVFQPNRPLPFGRKYEVSVDLNKLFDIPEGKNKTFEFTFYVVELLLQVKVDHISPYNTENNEWNYMEGSLFSTDELNTDELLKILTAEQKGKKLKLTWLDDHFMNKYNFRIDSIQRLENESNVFIEWDGDEVNSESEGELEIQVLPIHYFAFVAATVKNVPDQSIELIFSDAIGNIQLLDGLVYFHDQTPVQLSVEGNKIIVYPRTPLTGDATIVIKKEIKSSKNKNLSEDIFQAVFFGQLKPQIKFKDNGVIMPGKDGWILPFDAVNLDAIDVRISKIFAKNVSQFLQVNDLWGNYDLYRVAEQIHTETIQLDLLSRKNQLDWNTFALDLSKMINAEPGAIYRVELSFKSEYSLYDCPNGKNETENYWENMDNPCHDAYYNSGQNFAEKNVLASNIGLTVKNTGKEMMVYANNLLNTNPIEAVNLTFYTYQQQVIQIVKTNEKGEAKVEINKEPFLVVAEKEGQFAYLRLQGGDALSYSKFETDGITATDGLKGFLYGDRGVWRPGDSIFLSLIVQNSQGEFSPDHPATVELANPMGKTVFKQTLLKNINGFYAFVIPTEQDAITGSYNAVATVGGSSFYKQLRIENIKPNRLKINLDFEKNLLYGESNKAKLQVNWLHGGNASDLKTEIQATIKPMKTNFEKFTEFNFDDPSRNFYNEELVVFSGNLDAIGKANIDFKLPPATYAPGMLKTNFVTKVFEKGGDFSTDQFEMKYSPFSTYVGIKTSGQKGENDYFEVDKPLNFEVVTVDENGNSVDVSDLEVAVYKLDWSWWYSSYGSSLASYISSHYDEQIFQGKINTINGKGDFSIEIKYPDWGWYFVKVSDAKGLHSTGTKIYLDWPSWYNRDQRTAPGEASLISLAADRAKYLVGEKVHITLPTPANSKVLVSIEKNDKQIKSWWVDADDEETLISFEATEEMSPNVYVFVSVLQPFKQTVNDLPMRMYGLVPIMIENPQTLLQPVISIPKSVRPNQTYDIRISEKNNRKMTYTIAVVDDGLLDLTKFSTPDPHQYFYAKEALSVRTWDLYDIVMGAFAGRLEKVFAVGGDDQGNLVTGKKKAIRFKPVVSFLGPFTLEAGKSMTHTLKMSNYIGSVRCMVVAADGQSSGSAQETMKVTQPLMVLGTLPRVLSPGEKVVLPVSVFVMDEKIKNAEITVSVNDLFSLKESKKQLSVDQIGEKNTFFDLEVNQKQGIGKVKIEVKSGNETANYHVELDVRNPNPRVYKVDYHLLEKGETWTFNPTFSGMEGTNELNLVMSSFPSINLEQRMKFLVHYPYGCTEQITSSVFPQLFLDGLASLSKDEKDRIENNINLAIKKLNKRQNVSGGFSNWDGESGSNDYVTTYAGHFLLLAREKGYLVSSVSINSWIEYQTKTANTFTRNQSAYNFDFEQAYRLYSLALAGKPAVGAMNRLSEIKDLSASATYRLAAAYALIGQEAKARKLIDGVTYSIPENSEAWRYNYGSEARDLAMIMETYLILNEKDKALPTFKTITKKLGSNEWMSTQTTAFCLYTVAEMMGNNSDNSALAFTYQWNSKQSGEIISAAPVYSTPIEVGRGKELLISNKSGSAIYAAITSSGIPLLGQVITIQNNLNMKVIFKDMSGNAVNLNNIPHGLDFYAEITIKNDPINGSLDNIALSQLIPSGWEIINTRMLDLGSSLQSSKADYVDFKDDGVDMFFGLGPGETKRFIVLLNAAYMGEYYLPATQCAAMYNNDVNATVGGGWVKIVGKK